MRTLAALITFFIISHNLFAQGLNFKNQELSFSIGVAELDIQKLPSNENLNFMNYINFYPEYADFIIVKFGYRFDFLSNMSADIRLILMDDIIPDNYDISTHYYIKPWFGIGVGSLLNKNFITDTDFQDYQIRRLSDYYLLDYNVPYKIYDLGFYLSPTLKLIDNGLLEFLIKCDLGMSSLMKTSSTFYHKKKLSNERLIYHYKTKLVFQPYIQPKLDIRLKAFKIKETSIGFMLDTNYFYSKRSINYNRTIQTWTSENSINEQINLPKHKYSRFELNMGIFAGW